VPLKPLVIAKTLCAICLKIVVKLESGIFPLVRIFGMLAQDKRNADMLLKIAVFIILICGGSVMVLTTLEYHKLLAYYRQEVYESRRSGYTFNLLFFYLFIVGFIIGAVDVLLRDVDLRNVIAVLAFLLGAVYLYFSVRTQEHAAVMLREKVLEAIRTFVNTIDLKDCSFTGHSRQVYDVVRLFYEELRDYRHILNREKLLDAAILHDIGKINISADLLRKREDLTQEEWEILKSHTIRGKEMLDETCFRDISDWILYHHERVDGNGYYGLASQDIPVEAKIIAIADTYSALCSDRAYRSRMSHEEALALISRETGKQFDRKLVDCFLRVDKGALEQTCGAVSRDGKA
jgi:HD-GYP domain-containing protein (c-di-GMP phosphodiesterase class II)